MFQVLATLYRPKHFKDVVGQPSIVSFLQNCLKTHQIPPAFIFSGTRGVGKTTLARIFGNALRCSSHDQENLPPCLLCSECNQFQTKQDPNYLEIDGASYNSVDDIRALIESALFLPSSGKFKIFVIDEAHMLSLSAFNALLKTLEDPPPHAIFILATTNPQKIPLTVASRCQHLVLKEISLEVLTSYIKTLSQELNVSFESSKALTALCRKGLGSLRDTLTLFQQALLLCENSPNTAQKIITQSFLQEVFGILSQTDLEEILEDLVSGNTEQISQKFQKIFQTTNDIKEFSYQLLETLYLNIQQGAASPLFSKNNFGLGEFLWLYENLAKDFSWALQAPLPRQTIELILLKYSVRHTCTYSLSSPFSITKNSQKTTATTTALPKITNLPPPSAPSSLFKNLPSWDSFELFLQEKRPMWAAGINCGKIIFHPPTQNPPSASQLHVSFPSQHSIQYELAQSWKKGLEELLLAHFSYPVEVIFDLVENSPNAPLKTRAQEHQEQYKIKENQTKEEIKQHEAIVCFEKTFQVKVDKIILNSEYS